MDREKLYVTGNKNRMFINPSLGCNAACQYCYLPALELDKDIFCTSLERIINCVNEKENLGEFISGKEGTIVSFGCYTECWNPEVRRITQEAIFFFLEKGNYIQLATKEQIHESDIKKMSLKMQNKNQLTIFVSLPCFELSNVIEPYAEKAEKRINTFKYNQKYNIETVLYIKPVLEDITVRSISIYKDLIKRYKLRTVVGSYLMPNPSDSMLKLYVGNTEMWYQNSQQQIWIEEQLKEITEIYRGSLQIIEAYRKGENV